MIKALINNQWESIPKENLQLGTDTFSFSSGLYETFRTMDFKPVFLQEAEAAGLGGLKGHRSVGGIRASLYNGCPLDSVVALVAFMQDFEIRHA